MLPFRAFLIVTTLLVTCVLVASLVRRPRECGKTAQAERESTKASAGIVKIMRSRQDRQGGENHEGQHSKKLEDMVSGKEKPTLNQTQSQSGASSQTCSTLQGMLPYHPTDFGDQQYQNICEKAFSPPTVLENYSRCTPYNSVQKFNKVNKAEACQDWQQRCGENQAPQGYCIDIEDQHFYVLYLEQYDYYYEVIPIKSEHTNRCFELTQDQTFAGHPPDFFTSNLVHPEERPHQLTRLVYEQYDFYIELQDLRPKVVFEQESTISSHILSLQDIKKVFSNLISSQSFRQDTHCIPLGRAQIHECQSDVNKIKPEQPKDVRHDISPMACNPTQEVNTRKAPSTVLTQEESRSFDTLDLEKQGVEKPYNDTPKIRRKLTAGSCLGNTANYNLLDTNAQVKQSLFAGNVDDYGNLQTDANSGCDQEIFGLTNDHNVLTQESQPKNYWTAKLAESYTVYALLFIENQFIYFPNNYDNSWLSSYQITLGAKTDGSTNPVCVAFGTITKGGWFNCGLNGQYLSIVSATQRIAFSEIMAYSYSAVQMNAVSSIVCPLCLAEYPATRVLLQEVTLSLGSSTRVKTDPIATTNSTITIYLKAAIRIASVVLIGCSDLDLQPYQINTDISVQYNANLPYSCSHINDYNTYTESLCNENTGNSVIVSRSEPVMSFCGLGILANCNCQFSSLSVSSQNPTVNDIPSFFSGWWLYAIVGSPTVSSVTINFSIIPDTLSSVCGNLDGFTECGSSRTISFRDITNNVDMTTSPYKKVSWSCDTSTCILTLQNPENDYTEAESWQIQVKIALTAYPNVKRTNTIYVKIYGKTCSSQIGSMNLLNTAVQSFQSSYSLNYNTLPNAQKGCDLYILTTKPNLVYASDNSVPINYWLAVFPQSVSINTLLLIGPDASQIFNLAQTKVSIGSSSDFQNNPICLFDGQITDGGWYKCLGQGIYLTLWSTTDSVTFYEIMAYASLPIQWNSNQQTWNTLKADPTYPATNVLSKIVVVNNLDTTRQKCIASLAGTSSSGSLSLGFKAQTKIKAVILVPGSSITWQSNQKLVQVQVTDVSRTVSTCGIISDYNIYSEQMCNISGNLVTLSRSASNVKLSFCSIGILSDCDCTQSSFNPALIYPFQNVDIILSMNSISVTLGASQSQSTIILINQQILDTVSSVCGNANGKSYCGDRVISFSDAATSQEISSWPYKDFSYVAGTLILNPTTAQTTVIKVTVSLVSNPTVNKTEVLTAIVNPAPVQVVQYIPTQKLSATVNITGGLVLPRTNLPSTFNILSNQEFATNVAGNFFTVLSVKASDQGKTYTVSMNSVPTDANMPISYFSVQVKFIPASADPKSNANTAVGSQANKAVQTTSLDQVAQTASSDEAATVDSSAESASKSVTISDLELGYDCSKNDKNQMVCIDKKTGRKFIFNDKTEKLDFSEVKETALKIKAPTVTISPVSNMGIFYITFSEPMNMDRFLNTTTAEPKPQSRRLLSSVKTIPVYNASQELENSYRYLFNSSYIDIQTVSGGTVNSTMLNYTWQTTNITDTVISVQVRFMHPQYISSDGACPDKLQITMLQSKMSAYVSIKQQTVVDLPANQTRVLPVQLNLDKSSANLQQSASTLESVGQGTIAGQIVMNVVLSQAMSMMWSFVNALQILLAMPLINIPMPGAVYLVMQNLSSLAQFDVFPTQDILDFVFQFSDTDTAGLGFFSMGNTSKRLILYLGPTFLFMVLVAVNFLAWLFCYSLRKVHPFFERAQKKLKKFLFWSTILRLAVQGCLDISTGMMLSLEQLEWNTWSDVFDSVLTIISVPTMAALPLWVYLYLHKNFKVLQLSSFKRKFKPFLEEFLVDTDAQKKRTTPFMAWFILRRQLLALIIVPLRNQTVWIQLAGNTWLTLIDLCVKIHLSPYEKIQVGCVDKINDALVLFAGYFMYLFTDYTLTKKQCMAGSSTGLSGS